MSSGSVAYHLRVNKYIDRQLFLESLALLGRAMPLAGYGYVSMAGPYLEDCRILHQATCISRMYSFESNFNVLLRQDLNRPFGFVNCNYQTSGKVVAEFESIRAQLNADTGNTVVWLDYASPSARQSQLQELSTLVPQLVNGDIVRITMNAHRPTLGENVEFEKMPEESRPATLADWRHAKLKAQLGAYLPDDRDDSEFMTTKQEFFRTIIRAIKNVVIGRLEARPELLAFPVLSTAYDDQHGMVTVTFVVIPLCDLASFANSIRWHEWKFNPGPEWDGYVEVNVPHLSLSERQYLHRMISPDGVFKGEASEFISREEFAQYCVHYLRYPTFVPLDIL